VVATTGLTDENDEEQKWEPRPRLKSPEEPDRGRKQIQRNIDEKIQPGEPFTK